MPIKVNINSSPLKNYADKLKTLSRYALPVTVKKTLNDTAYHLKKESMPKRAERQFKKRQPNFFKANSKVIQAQGFNIKDMSSQVGFYSNSLRGKNNRAVTDLEKQEDGGYINKKTFVPEEGARAGDKKNGLVKANRRLGKLPSLINRVSITSTKGKTKSGRMFSIKSRKQRFIRAAFVAKKQFNGFILGNKNRNGNRTLSVISSLIKRGNTISMKRAALYNVKNGRAVKVKATQFMKRASYESGLMMEYFFIKNSQEKIIKHLGR